MTHLGIEDVLVVVDEDLGVVDDVARQEVGTPPTLLAQLCASTEGTGSARRPSVRGFSGHRITDPGIPAVSTTCLFVAWLCLNGVSVSQDITTSCHIKCVSVCLVSLCVFNCVSLCVIVCHIV